MSRLHEIKKNKKFDQVKDKYFYVEKTSKKR